MWNEKYFNPKPKPVQISLPQAQTNNLQPQMPNLMQKPKLKDFGDYDKNLINKFYNHAKQSHRKDVQKKRNEWTYDSFLNGFNK